MRLLGSREASVASPTVIEPSVGLRRRSRRWTAQRLSQPSTYLFVLVVLVFAALIDQNRGNGLFLATTVAVYAIAAIGQDWLIGRAGQVSIGGAAFVGIGAFATVATTGTPFHYFPIPIIISAAAGAIVGLIVGLPASRLGGLYLVLTTLALQYVFGFVAQEYQGRRLGGIPAPTLSLFGQSLSGARSLFALVCVVLVLVVLLLHNLYRYAPGNMWRAIRDDPLASGTIGISVMKWRLLAFIGSSAVTAVAGSLFAYLIGVVSYTTFTLDLGISLIVMVYFGGVGSPLGVLLGAAAVTYLPNLLTDITKLTPTGSSVNTWLMNNSGTLENLVYGLALVVVLLFEPGGLAGLGRRLLARAARLGWPIAAHCHTTAAPSADAAPIRTVIHSSVDVGEHVDASPLPAVSPQRHVEGALLSVRRLSVRYANGGAGAADIDLDVQPRSVVAVVGRNGAGKTSTLRGIAGYLRAERVRVNGSVMWKGQDITGSSPRQTGRLGIVLVPERFKVFPSLTVAEHFKAAGMSAKREQECLEQFAGLQRFATTKGGLLSGGERQLLAIALAVARRPELLLVDELSLGLSPVATQSIVSELIRAQTEEGFAILLVDQAAGQIAKIVEYYYLLEGGSIIGQGSADEISEQQLRATVMGR